MSHPLPPVVWRIPPYQTALLLLVVCAGSATVIYGHPSVPVRAVVVIVSLAALTGAIAALRMYLVVDDDGVGVRRLRTESSVAWADFRSVEVVTVGRGNATVRVTRRDGTFVDVPPSLLLPSLPTPRHKALGGLHDAADGIRRRAPGHGHEAGV